jgi:sugar phosphate isomerase/epimerase
MLKPKIALSTCWCSQRHIDGYEMIKAMVDLGFEYVDLSHGVRISLIPGLLRALDEKLMKVSYVHNFCPLPTGISHAAPNLYQPSSPERKERQLWVRQTSRTIDFTSRVGADRIVAHFGSISFFWTDPERTINRLRAGRDSITINSDERYRRLVEKYLVKARRKAVVVMDRVRQCLAEVIPLAKEKGISFGVENREGFMETPL